MILLMVHYQIVEAWDQIVGSSEHPPLNPLPKKDLLPCHKIQGEELNGRFTALQISNEEIKNSMLSMLVRQ